MKARKRRIARQRRNARKAVAKLVQKFQMGRVDSETLMQELLDDPVLSHQFRFQD